MIKTGDTTFRYEIPKLIISIWNKEELPEMWYSRSLYISM